MPDQHNLPPTNERASLEDLDRAPVSLPQTQPIDYRGELETLRERFNQVTSDKERLQQDFDDLRRASNTVTELDKLIAPSARKAFTYMSLYSTGSFSLLLLDGFRWHNFDLDESVLDLLVGSTAVTVLGLVGMVLTGIFVGARKAISKLP